MNKKKKTQKEKIAEEKARREYTEYFRFENHKNLLATMSLEYLWKEDLQEAKKQFAKYYESLPPKVRDSNYFQKKIAELLKKRA